MKRRDFLLSGIGALALASIPFSSARADKKRQIALTFDDGPRPRILNDLLPLLRQHNVPGTFFVIGSIAKDHADLLKKMMEEGFEIENHSWDHENLRRLLATKGPEAVRSNLARTSEVIYQITGRAPLFFRPPYLATNSKIEALVASLGLKSTTKAGLDLDTRDYVDAIRKNSNLVLTERVKKIVFKSNQKSLVLLFHELPITVRALEMLLPYFQEQGYQFLRLDGIISSVS